MEKGEVQELFCAKIGMELEKFKTWMLKQKPEIILGNAYRIDCMISIYELLLDMRQKIPESSLKSLLIFPNLLGVLYSGWIKREDSHMEELESCLSDIISGMNGIFGKLEENAA